ncbi:hypothetical protein YPPY64_0659, partial [Yersinia pestis PY-64]
MMPAEDRKNGRR